MSQIKGHVFLSRFEYLDHKKGLTELKQLLNRVSTPEANFVRQPVDGASFYSENTLAEIDEILLKDYFDNDLEEFRRLGEWNANNVISRFFSLYIEEGNPAQFLEQFARLRDSIIGSGEMKVVPESDDLLLVTIDYGQSVPRSVCLSEQGFILGGLKLCGAKSVEINELSCASEGSALTCQYEISYK